jgi:hypothetical protein
VKITGESTMGDTTSTARLARAAVLATICTATYAGAGETAAAASVGSDNPQPFTISGLLSGPLFPGAGVPLDLSLANPNPDALTLTGLAVRITGVQPVGAGICSAADFTIVQPLITLPAILPGLVSETLSVLGLPLIGQPQVQMLDTAADQDGCQGATLTLQYTGTAYLTDSVGHSPVPGHGGSSDSGDGSDSGNGSTSGTGAGLPGTGSGGHDDATALAGLGLAGAGAVLVLAVRRRKQARS